MPHTLQVPKRACVITRVTLCLCIVWRGPHHSGRARSSPAHSYLPLHCYSKIITNFQEMFHLCCSPRIPMPKQLVSPAHVSAPYTLNVSRPVNHQTMGPPPGPVGGLQTHCSQLQLEYSSNQLGVLHITIEICTLQTCTKTKIYLETNASSLRCYVYQHQLHTYTTTGYHPHIFHLRIVNKEWQGNGGGVVRSSIPATTIMLASSTHP